MSNFNFNNIDQIQLMCNRNFKVYKEYEVIEIDGDYYFRPKLNSNIEPLFLDEHVDEAIFNQLELNLNKSSDAILELINIRSDYAQSEFVMMKYEDLSINTKKSVSKKILKYLQKYGQLGFVFHIIYDYIQPSISIASDYQLPNINNPFSFSFHQTQSNYKSLSSFGIDRLITNDELLRTFFPTFKSDTNSSDLSAAIGTDIDHLELVDVAFQSPIVMNQYCEPLKYYIAAIEILYSLISENSNQLILLSENFCKDGDYFINNARIVLRYNSKDKEYQTHMEFKSLYDFFVFTILQSKTNHGVNLKCCEYKLCNKIIKLDGRSDQKYCDEHCKSSQRDYLRKENRKKKRENESKKQNRLKKSTNE